MNDLGKAAVLAVALGALGSMAIYVAAQEFCRLHRDTTLVCTRGQNEPGWTCSSTSHMWWSCWDSGSGSQWTFPVLPPPLPSSYYDANGDGIIDRWNSMVTTSDPCARNFDLGDRLGSDHGGTNTRRPDHRGVDIQCNAGDPVRAWRDGLVIASRFSGSCGQTIALRHSDGSVSTYCHFSTLLPEEGDSVDAGEVIGRCGDTGRTTGPHVHLGVRTLTGSYVEYFDFTSLQPSPTQLDPGGC